jgi:hypothetical protein
MKIFFSLVAAGWIFDFYSQFLFAEANQTSLSLKVTDKDEPPLARYKRVKVTILPK